MDNVNLPTIVISAIVVLIIVALLPVLNLAVNNGNDWDLASAIEYMNNAGYTAFATGSLTAGRIPIVDTVGLTDDDDLTFSGDTTIATKIETGELKDDDLTSGGVVIAGTDGILSTDAGLTYDAGTGILGVTTGRSATYVIAALNSPDIWKAQADVVCDGTSVTGGDEVEINAALDAGTGNGIHVLLAPGTFYTSAPVDTFTVASSAYSIFLQGSGMYSTRTVTTTGSNWNAIDHTQDNTYGIIRRISDLAVSLTSPTAGSCIYVYNSASGKAVGDYHIDHCGISYGYTYGIYMGGLDTPAWGPKIEDCWIEFCTGTGIYFYAQQGYMTNTFVAYNGAKGLIIPLGSKDCQITGCEIGRAGEETVTVDGTGNKFTGCTISSWGYTDATAYGMYLSGEECIVNGCTISGVVTYPSYIGIGIANATEGNIITANTVDGCSAYGITIASGTTAYDNQIKNNFIDNAIPSFILNQNTGLGNIISGNINYIAPSETRTASGSIAAGLTNAIGFSWHNPELQDCYIKRVVVSVNSAAAAAATGQVGIADDNAGTNLGSEFFTAITLDATGVYDSYIAGDTGAQTKYVLIQDTASATDGWINLKILVNDSTATGTYYIEYVGK